MRYGDAAHLTLVSSPDIQFFARALRPCRQGRRARAKNWMSGDETNLTHAHKGQSSDQLTCASNKQMGVSRRTED